MKSKLATALLSATIALGGYAASVHAYPGMQKKQGGEVQSSVDLINVLPKAYPIEPVPFKDAQGKSIDFSQYRGQVVMVNMWATWCPPCVRELPAIDRFKGKFDPKQFRVLPISIDMNGKEKVEPFLASLGMDKFETYYDPQQQLGEVFPLDTIPATFILNQQGELIAFVRTFVDWDDDKAVKLIESFIASEVKKP
ncbi:MULTISPECIES: TlpA disulfide reductase family protein [Shewanella]|uniref:TlpA disulfide reductase family protein n=1 Tax=Shewanella TaxID=22 RepID=UPI001EFCA03B|nr:MULTISPECIES: TlpA disulfide reductase family protein [Shewanella]MCG9748799.1 TlpA family protein disulfide reductase [Shewanella sp. Isolate8]MCL2912136.1 TlpA family protein disulfide reductase [Shewanella aquimarina]